MKPVHICTGLAKLSKSKVKVRTDFLPLENKVIENPRVKTKWSVRSCIRTGDTEINSC